MSQTKIDQIKAMYPGANQDGTIDLTLTVDEVTILLAVINDAKGLYPILENEGKISKEQCTDIIRAVDHLLGVIHGAAEGRKQEELVFH